MAVKRRPKAWPPSPDEKIPAPISLCGGAFGAFKFPTTKLPASVGFSTNSDIDATLWGLRPSLPWDGRRPARYPRPTLPREGWGRLGVAGRAVTERPGRPPSQAGQAGP